VFVNVCDDGHPDIVTVPDAGIVSVDNNVSPVVTPLPLSNHNFTSKTPDEIPVPVKLNTIEFNCSGSPGRGLVVFSKLNNNTGTFFAPDNWLDDGTGVAGPVRDANIGGIVGV
jgi:hypothetical protein